MTGTLFARDALLPGGWARDVRLEWDEAGTLSRVNPGAAPEGAPVAAGPVLPGMPNLHSHAFQRAMAGLAETRGHPTDDFWTWREAMYHLVAHLEPEDVGAIARQLYIEMLKHGYTSVAEFHYLQHDRQGKPYADRGELAHRVVDAARETGLAMTLLPVLYVNGGFGHKPLNAAQRRFAGTAESIADLLRELIGHYANEPWLRFGVAPHSARAVDAVQLTELVQAMEGIDATAPIHIHASEQVGEVRECFETQGVTPIDWIMDLAPVDRRWCFVHATHATDEERERMRHAGAVAGLCPTTEANLGDGIFAFAEHFGREGRWGIGGDSHVSRSPLEELRALEYSQRLARQIRNVSSSGTQPEVATNLWLGACAGGAQALGQPIGALLPGRRADIVVLDGGKADFEALAAPATLAVAMFSGAGNPVRDVFVSGRPVVVDGRHRLEDEARGGYRESLRRLRDRT
ncbi:formimidoylglutamate deiminase [Betaproteobacteria bacterium GR16-43]|nr:formimidoylglutamate deiminase [Betaproteobacteria bacterium GR16-43]